MILNALFVSSVSYWIHLLVRSLTFFFSLVLMVKAWLLTAPGDDAPAPLWLEQWTLRALLACWPCGDWVPWSFAHPLCTLDTHRERDPPPPTSQPQFCPTSSDSVCSPCLWRKGSILPCPAACCLAKPRCQSNIPAALASITSFPSHGLIYTVFFPQLFDCFQRQHGDRGQKET